MPGRRARQSGLNYETNDRMAFLNDARDADQIKTITGSIKRRSNHEHAQYFQVVRPGLELIPATIRRYDTTSIYTQIELFLVQDRSPHPLVPIPQFAFFAFCSRSRVRPSRSVPFIPSAFPKSRVSLLCLVPAHPPSLDTVTLFDPILDQFHFLPNRTIIR